MPSRTFASWRTLVLCGRLEGTTSRAVHPARTLATTASGDNLAILIEDPRFYKCWAGCSKEMIRAALGCPIRVRSSA